MRGLNAENIAKAVGANAYVVEGGIVRAAEKSDLPENEASGVVIDSRLCEKNYVFVATKGERVDGADYIGSCFEKGALLAITERTPSEGAADGLWLVVGNSLTALKRLAAFYREIMKEVRIVGIVGSVGKTSTKELTAAALSAKYSVLATKGNLNNEIGVPLTLLRIGDEHEVAVVEMGISDFGEMSRLGAMVRPDVVLFTNIAPCHLEKLGDLWGVLRAKTEIFGYIKENGIAILNNADTMLRTIREVRGTQLYFYGPDSAMTAENVREEAGTGSVFEAVYDDGGEKERFEVRLGIPGSHMIGNALGALLAAKLMGVDCSAAAKGIEAVKTSDTGRSVRETVDGVDYINDAYNASPLSVKAAIDLLAAEQKRKVAILGDMLELGNEECKLHAEIGEYAAKKGVNLLICAGKLSKNTAEGYGKDALWFESTDELVSSGALPIMKGDTVLIKASHGMHFEKIVSALRDGSLKILKQDADR
ncbi:MAG: UDP-N-acetylmuramoyl-tripeptide--D-alanyl-D-alanine ligase [Lachnospiraceae bacterium]|nr:UDP-N-acetylmuramoyl-tripeptide--D-alanyl-D-alanine ligase [Lachnospiraceae bacterium]